LSDGVHNVAIHDIVDIHGTTLTPDDFSFMTDTVPPFVTGSSIFDGEVFSPAPQDITEIVDFSEPMNTAFTNSSSFDLYGSFRNIHYAASAFTWNGDGTELTINYNNLPSDAYQLTLFAFGFQDPAGNFLASDFSVNFFVLGGGDITGLRPVLPMGSL